MRFINNCCETGLVTFLVTLLTLSQYSRALDAFQTLDLQGTRNSGVTICGAIDSSNSPRPNGGLLIDHSDADMLRTRLAEEGDDDLFTDQKTLRGGKPAEAPPKKDNDDSKT